MLAGDFNATPDSPAIAEISREWTNLTNDDFTISSTNPVKKIDYIFGKSSGGMKVLSTRTCCCITLSEHLPIVSVIDF